jgi:hypothetical protein
LNFEKFINFKSIISEFPFIFDPSIPKYRNLQFVDQFLELKGYFPSILKESCISNATANVVCVSVCVSYTGHNKKDKVASEKKPAERKKKVSNGIQNKMKAKKMKKFIV